MDALLSSGFSPYYPPDDLEDVLPLEEDALLWLNSLTIVPDASSDAQHPSIPSPLSFDSAPASSSTSGSGTTHSPEVDARHSNGNSNTNSNDHDHDHASSEEEESSSSSSEESSSSSSEESSSSSSEGHRGKKARISLDPCQPLTVKGKPRTRVYVACRECRNRKVRCDGAKPVCFNCSKRDPSVDACDYDAAPRRRGQDKVPGSRVRSGIGQRAQCRAEDKLTRANGQRPPTNEPGSGANLEGILQGFDPATFDPKNVASYELPAPLPSGPTEDEDATAREQERSVDDHITDVPNMKFARETWWDALLVFYAADGAVAEMTLTADQRLTTTKLVFADIRAVLNASMYWASFLHLPRFFETILDPKRRRSVQPSLILSMLAIGAHSQSSEVMHGAKGRARARKLIDLADSAIKASLSTNWVDIGLVQAAWFITYFEMQGHSQQELRRCEGAVELLDSLIRLLSLTTLDADRPEAHYSIFATSSSNMVGQSMFNGHAGAHAHPHPPAPPGGNRASETADIPELSASTPKEGPSLCDCLKYTLKEQWPTVSEVAPLWEMTTMWPDGLMEGEIRKEECRRLVWSSVMLSAGQNAYTAADGELDRTELFIKDYRNLAILFPGEDLVFSSNGQVLPNNVWTLCIRSIVLWHTSMRQRGNPALSTQARAEYAVNAWLEADAIEAALNMHTCQLEGAQLYQTREYLFAVRMCISHEFRLYAPQVTSLGIMSFYREKAEAWLRIQMQVSEHLWRASQEEVKWEMMNRPLLCYWFMGHIVRALLLYKSDPTLLIALDAAKAHVKPLEFLMRLWPYDDQRQKWACLRRELVQTCLEAGVPPPSTDVPTPFERIRRKTTPSLPAPQI